MESTWNKSIPYGFHVECGGMVKYCENATAIWEYDPTQANNHVLGGSLNMIAAIRTLAIKVRLLVSLRPHALSHNIYGSDSSIWAAY